MGHTEGSEWGQKQDKWKHGLFLSLYFIWTFSKGDWVCLGRISNNGVVSVSRRHMPLIMGFHSLLFPLPSLFCLSDSCALVVFVTLCLLVTLFLGPSLLSLTLSLRPSSFVIQGPCSSQVLLSNSRLTVLTHLVCHFIVAISFFNLKE